MFVLSAADPARRTPPVLLPEGSAQPTVGRDHLVDQGPRVIVGGIRLAESLEGWVTRRRPAPPEDRDRRIMLGLALGLMAATLVGVVAAMLILAGSDRRDLNGELDQSSQISACHIQYPTDEAAADACIASLP